MSPRRLETFTDGVIAVVITIMVLSLRPPTGSSLHDLRPLVPKLSVYLLSFVFVVALAWLIPDRRMERVLTTSPRDTE